MTYKFVVAPGATFDRDYRVFVHFLNAEDEQMWTDDHDPPRPTQTWKAGRDDRVHADGVRARAIPTTAAPRSCMGLYSPEDGHARWRSAPRAAACRPTRSPAFELVPQAENIFLIYKDGWHPAEDARDNGAVVVAVDASAGVDRLPQSEARRLTFYLQLDGRPDLQPVRRRPSPSRIGEQVHRPVRR